MQGRHLANNNPNFGLLLTQSNHLTSEDLQKGTQTHMAYFYDAFVPFWELNSPNSLLLSLDGKEQLGHSANYLLLCSTEERKAYRFGMM